MTTQTKTWANFELLDRQSILINEDGSKDELNPELAQALRDHLYPMPDKAIREFIRDILADIGVADMADLSGADLTTILRGILED